ncbi:MAG: 5-oxoprolinase subunit PxpA [Blastocatellia bacterium]
MASIDLNCDMGEGCDNDAELMKLISSANIACGFHAGDRETMRMTVELAIEKEIAIGAHPGYPDRENFGRNTMSMRPEEIREIVTEQIFILKEIAETAGGRLHHVKPHGALYNQAARDAELAGNIASAVMNIDQNLVLFGLSGSVSISEAEAAGLKTASEVFADRTYQANGSLTPRTEPNALINDEGQAVAQVVQMVNSKSVTAISGEIVPIKAETVCIHGDGEYAVEFAKLIRKALSDNNITVASISFAN